MSKKSRNYIDVDEAIELFEAYGFKAREFNFYQIRIKPEEFDGFYDWYHTTGSLVCTTRFGNKGLGHFLNPEDVCIKINKFVYA